MSRYISDEYAAIMTDEDVLELFGKLVEALGSLSKAAKRCGLERRTIYNWRNLHLKRGSARLRGDTKRKVLRALLDEAPDEALAYLNKRSKHSAVDLLSLYLRTLYENASEPGLPSEEFGHLIAKFDEAASRNAGLIMDGRMDEDVASMQASLRKHASERGVPYEPKPPELATGTGLTNIMPALMAEIRKQPPGADAKQLSKDFNLPERFVSTISRSLGAANHCKAPRPKTAQTGKP